MSRPCVIVFLALMVGVGIADHFLYDAEWLATASTQASWMLFAPWGFCVVLTFLALWCHWREGRLPFFVRHSAFPWITALCFVAVGFGRYAFTAEQLHRERAVRGKPVPRGNPDELDFARWDWVQGLPMKAWESKSVAKPSGGMAAARTWGLALREQLTARLQQSGMAPERLGVVMAMTLGDRSQLARDTRDLYASSGASHLLALSGLHLGIIVGIFLTWMNGRLLLSRWRRVVGLLVLVFIWTYCLVAGMPTSLVRASVMTSVFVAASLMQRYGSSLQHLLLTGILLLLARPLYLFDVGAQLSFTSVAGILAFYPPLQRWCFARWRFQIFWLERYHLFWPFKLVAVSLCAQVSTLPLVAWYFHQIPLYAPLLSIVVIPLTTLIIYGAFLMLALTFIWPLLASWVSVGVGWVIGVQWWVMTAASKWPGAVIPDFWSVKAQPQVVVYHNRRCPAAHIIASPSESWLLMPAPERADSGLYYIRRDFWRRRLTAEPKVITGHEACVAGFRVVMLRDNPSQDAEQADAGIRPGTVPQRVELLWVTSGFKGGHLAEAGKRYSPRLLVLDASLPLWQRAALAQEAWARGWSVYDVAEQGALRVALEQ